MTLLSTMLTVVAIFILIVNPTNATPSRGMRAESLEMESRDVPAVANVIDEISSLIRDASMLEEVVKFFPQSSAPTHDSVHGCDEANDNTKLKMLIDSSQDGQVRLCPGKITFSDEIELDKSISISCAGPKGSCILDGNEDTRHFFSFAGLTFAFIDLTFINGVADDGNQPGPLGGSLFLDGGSTNILDGCVFYNNLATSTSKIVGGGAIYASGGETVVNNCLFLDNVAVTTAAVPAFGGAINSFGSNLKVIDSIFKNNKALSTVFGGGGAINTLGTDVLVLSSVFESNEASKDGGAALFSGTNVDWYNNKDLLFGNDADELCDGVAVVDEDCFNVGDNFSFDLP